MELLSVTENKPSKDVRYLLITNHTKKLVTKGHIPSIVITETDKKFLCVRRIADILNFHVTCCGLGI